MQQPWRRGRDTVRAATDIPIVKVLFKAGKNSGSQASRNKEVLSGALSVTKGVKYLVKIEVLRNDLGDASEKVASIKIDGKEVGKKSGAACKPDGKDYDCTFYDCKSQVTDNLVVTAASSTMKVALDFKEHSWDCDCDKSSWKCGKEGSKTGDEVEAVARVTLTQIILCAPTRMRTHTRGVI